MIMKIGTILGSCRPGHNGAQVACWVQVAASKREDAQLDLADHPPPLLDEPLSASIRHHQHDHTKRWSATIGRHDEVAFGIPMCSHSTSGRLKNAIATRARSAVTCAAVGHWARALHPLLDQLVDRCASPAPVRALAEAA